MVDAAPVVAPAPAADPSKPSSKKRDRPSPRPPHPPPPPIHYAHRDGLRHVQPYVYSFHARAKGRWWGKTILEVFEKEFRYVTGCQNFVHLYFTHSPTPTHPLPTQRTYNPAYYKASIRSGTISVNGQTVGLDYVLKNNDLIIHKCHRHEPPVVGDEVRNAVA